MTTNTNTVDDDAVRARIPADLDAPDRILAGLTAHQVAVLAVVAVPIWLTWQTLTDRVPLAVLAAATAPVAALAVALALGRRDGIGLDAWLLAAVGNARTPSRLLPVPGTTGDVPAWAPAESGPTGRRTRTRPGLLRLPGEAIGPDGVIATTTGTSVALVAAATVTAGLHTQTEQAALVAGYARWLNSLSGPVQIVVSARRVDLGARALHVADAAPALPDPALARAAIGHAQFLLDLAEDVAPLARTVTIAHTAVAATTGGGLFSRRPGRRGRLHSDAASRAATAAGGQAGRRAAQTVAALAAIGSRCQVLDAGAVTAVLTAAVDPFGPADAHWPRTPPEGTVTSSVPVSPPAPPPDWTGLNRGPGAGGPGRSRSERPGADRSGPQRPGQDGQGWAEDGPTGRDRAERQGLYDPDDWPRPPDGSDAGERGDHRWGQW